MGQRLVVHVYEKNKEVANAYYHWSGYTLSSLYVLRYIAEAYNKDNKISAVDLLKASGAKLAEDEDCNRNDGIIETTEEGMEESSKWSEGDIDIFLDQGLYDFNVLGYADLEYIKECYSDFKIEDIETLKYNLCHMRLNDVAAIDDLIDIISELEDTQYGLFKINDYYYQSIY